MKYTACPIMNTPSVVPMALGNFSVLPGFDLSISMLAFGVKKYIGNKSPEKMNRNINTF